jgi:cell wall-active antibiotic response 4TMS protein YvqF/B-box zinc finger protein
MNCNTHGDTAAVAFCRTCGKPLCNQCTRDVRGVIYCEACLAARMEGTAPAPFVPVTPPQPPPTGYQQFMDQGLGLKVPPGPASGPNPAVAGILAGFFPIGVGAVYTGQYAKGLAHLAIAVLMIMGVSSDEVPWQAKTILGISMGFFYIYQIIDSVRSAKAVQTGEPVPDPFGLAQAFGAGERLGLESTKVPAGAAVLIGLGVIFLLHTVGLFSFSIDRFWPLILVFLGVWLFAKQWGFIGGTMVCRCERCRTRKMMGPAILVTLGIVFLIGFWHAWPAILLVIGVVKLMQSNASSEGHTGPLPPGMSTGIPTGYPQGFPPASAAYVAPQAPQEPQNPDQTASSGEVKNV